MDYSSHWHYLCKQGIMPWTGSQGFQGNESCWCLRSSLTLCQGYGMTDALPRPLFWWVDWSSQLCSWHQPRVPPHKPPQVMLSAGYQFWQATTTPRKKGAMKHGHFQEISLLFLFPHAVTSLRITMGSRAAVVTTQAGFYGYIQNELDYEENLYNAFRYAYLFASGTSLLMTNFLGS